MVTTQTAPHASHSSRLPEIVHTAPRRDWPADDARRLRARVDHCCSSFMRTSPIQDRPSEEIYSEFLATTSFALSAPLARLDSYRACRATYDTIRVPKTVRQFRVPCY
mmetsp:Transcript_22416/g.70198  ORF Transcript_22416/g.70198 Transcript_22416/m.70198 type:complete len:108 (+) Transcript_22416:1271-1594(+)